MLGSTKQPQKCWKRAVHGSFLRTITHVKHVPNVYTALAQMAYEVSRKDCDYTSRTARVLSKATYSFMTGRSVESSPVYGRFPGDNYPCTTRAQSVLLSGPYGRQGVKKRQWLFQENSKTAVWSSLQQSRRQPAELAGQPEQRLFNRGPDERDWG